MFELIEFYNKNALHLLLFMLIGFIIAMLDVSFRNLVKRVYLNVRRNIEIRHGTKEGLDMGSIDKFEEKTKEDAAANKKKQGSKKKTGGGGGDGGGDGDDEEGEGECPKDCDAVLKLQERLTKLITDAMKLKEDVKANNLLIEKHEKTIEALERNLEKLAQKKK
jgi:hypothetical protein